MSYSNDDIWWMLQTSDKPMTARQIYDGLDLPPKDKQEEAYLYARLRGMAKRKRYPLVTASDERGRITYHVPRSTNS